MKLPMIRASHLLALSLGLTGLSTSMSHASEVVNIYSYRQAALLKPLLDAFTAQTGINTKVLFAAKGLSQRIASEGVNSPADVLLTTDISRLDAAKSLGITQSVSNAEINNNVPAQYRDQNGHWFGLTTRARVIYASKDRVAQDSITYEELASPKWKGKICTRSGQHVYSIGLFASMIHHLGEEGAQNWMTGLRNNLARRPTGNDRAQVKAIYAGECDIALGNTYYMGKMQTNSKEPEQKDWANSVRILFPNTKGRGTHVNLSGMVLAKHAPHRDNTLKLMAFLSSEQAQVIYAKSNFEYPIKAGVLPDELVASWGEFQADSVSLNDVAKLRKRASELVDQVGFDDGPGS